MARGVLARAGRQGSHPSATHVVKARSGTDAGAGSNERQPRRLCIRSGEPMNKISLPRRPRRIDQAKVPVGSLLLLDESGAVHQMVPPAVAESMRLMVARLRVGQD